jgi:hypothetical protein
MTPNQFMFCYMKHTYHIGGEKLLKRYFENVKRFQGEEIKDLIKRGYVEDFNEPGKDFMDSYLITPKFVKAVFIDTDEAGEELWNTYPAYLMINSVRVAARSCDKEEIIERYAKIIKNNIKKHKEIIELLKKAIKRGEINMGIEKWVKSEQWEILKGVKEDRPNTTAI